MPRIRRADFYEEIAKLEQVIDQLRGAESDALRRMLAASAGPARSAALSVYRRAASAQLKAISRRQKFLDRHRP